MNESHRQKIFEISPVPLTIYCTVPPAAGDADADDDDALRP